MNKILAKFRVPRRKIQKFQTSPTVLSVGIASLIMQQALTKNELCANAGYAREGQSRSDIGMCQHGEGGGGKSLGGWCKY